MQLSKGVYTPEQYGVPQVLDAMAKQLPGQSVVYIDPSGGSVSCKFECIVSWGRNKQALLSKSVTFDTLLTQELNHLQDLVTDGDVTQAHDNALDLLQELQHSVNRIQTFLKRTSHENTDSYTRP